VENNQNNINKAADALIYKIKHFLITKTGKTEKEVTTREFYQAFSTALHEEIMINWTATMKTYNEKQARTIYYLSMEYLPGKILSNNTTNLRIQPIIEAVLSKTNRNWHDLFACDPDLGLGNGGLGRLASCFLDSLAAQKYPAWAYGLRYQYGIFEQEIWDGVQVERPDCWLLHENPWEFRRDTEAKNVLFRGKTIPAVNTHGDEVFLLEDYEEVRALAYDYPLIGYAKDSNYNVNTLRLWSTKESPRNFHLQRYNSGQLDQAGENTSLTDVLYPNDHHDTGKRIRLKQEFLLVSASLQDIIKHHLRVYGDLSLFADKTQIQINDTHPALMIAELMRRLTKDHDIPWNKAWETVKACCNYTNHTILKEALEEWNEQRMGYLLPRQYKIIQKLNHQFCNQIRAKFPNDEQKVKEMSFIENGQVKMANLAIYGSKKINGVAELHGNILKNQLFRDFNTMYPDRFIHITNGVSPRNWLLGCNHLLSEFITKRIGDKWITDFDEIKKISEFASDETSQKEFLKIKRKNKEILFDCLSKKNPIRDQKGKIIGHTRVLSPDALLDVQIKRIHEYKRQLMNALHLLMLYWEIKENPQTTRIPRMAIIGGKAAPGYEIAKNIIRLFFCIARKIDADPEVNKYLGVAFLENYNVSFAEKIIPAADLSEQISTAGMEASGTGNMKLSMNGALTIGTEDGANIEMRESITDKWWPFSFGASADELQELKEKGINPALNIYNQNEKIRRVIDNLKDGSLTINENEHKSLYNLYQTIIEGQNESAPDRFFILHDFLSYYETQKKVEELYKKPNLWAEYAIHNMAGMGRFSSDEVIYNYVQSIWGLEKCPVDEKILKFVVGEFSQLSICKTYQENI
jgi:starch phosphorylase